MSEAKLQALLSGYAAGTLTQEEQQELFALALNKQEVFDALLKEQPMRETLDDPQIRARLLAQLQPAKQPATSVASWWKWAAPAAILAASIVIGLLWRKPLATPRSRQAETAQVRLPASEARREPPLPPLSPQAPAAENHAQKAVKLPSPKPTAAQSPPPMDRYQPNIPEPPSVEAPPGAGVPPDNDIAVPAPQRAAIVQGGAPLLAPQALFMSQWTTAKQDIGFQSFRYQAAAPAVALSKPPAPQPRVSSAAIEKLPVQQQNAAIRVTLHDAGKQGSIDWRTANASKPLIVTIDTTAEGYIAVVEFAEGRLQTLLAGTTPTAARSTATVSLSAQVDSLTVIYSPVPVVPARRIKAAPSPTDEIHTAAEHAIYAGSPGPALELVVRLKFSSR